VDARPELSWLEPFLPWDGMQYAPLPAALERLSDYAPPSVHVLTIDQLIDSVGTPYIRSLTATAQTLLNGDAHVGNTSLLPTGEVGFLDQVARRGNFSLNLGYFVQGGVDHRGPPQQRAGHSRGIPRRLGIAGR
jgi:hypothetical protein